MSGYTYPQSVAEALALLEEANGEARILAGGTDLLPDLQSGALDPALLVDITRIPELHTIQIGKEYAVVGAAVPFSDIKTHSALQQAAPVLTQAASSIGAGGIQQTATWAGNIVQAMPAADGAIAAIALEAEACIVRSGGEVWSPVEELFLGPGVSTVDPTRELITAIRFPVRSDLGRIGTAWRRIGRRAALILPILNCGVKLIISGGPTERRIISAVLAVGPAGTVPFRARTAENSLQGVVPGMEAFREAAALAREESQPRSNPLRASKEYRLAILPTLLEEALQEALLITNP